MTDVSMLVIGGLIGLFVGIGGYEASARIDEYAVNNQLKQLNSEINNLNQTIQNQQSYIQSQSQTVQGFCSSFQEKK